jgi:hypothetical protein
MTMSASNTTGRVTDRSLPFGFSGDEDVDVSANAGVVAQLPVPVDAFYAAYLSGDLEGMLAALRPSVTVRFPSYLPLRGLDQARAFFDFQSTLFGRMDFQLIDTFTVGTATVVIWREDGTTAAGEPWRCHGVDTVIADSSGISSIEVGGSGWPLRELLPRFPQRGPAVP